MAKWSGIGGKEVVSNQSDSNQYFFPTAPSWHDAWLQMERLPPGCLPAASRLPPGCRPSQPPRAPIHPPPPKAPQQPFSSLTRLNPPDLRVFEFNHLPAPV